jgi:phage terminase large subunit-like protein
MNVEDRKAIERYRKKLEHIVNASKVDNNETEEQRKAAIERARKDVKYCVERYFPHYATSECADFQIELAHLLKRHKHFTGFAKWGRALAKSVWNNVIIPFWLWLDEGDYYFVQIGVSEKRAIQLLADLKAEFEANPQIIRDFGPQVTKGDWENELWITKGGFIGQALGFGQSLRGLRVGPRRPKHYSCDDLETRQTIKNPARQDEMVNWVQQELIPSMDGTHERLVFANNWFAPKMFLRSLAALHPDWIVHEVKAYNPITYEPRWKAKYTADYYRKKEKRMGILDAHAEYNHDAKVTGKIFKPEMISWDKLPQLNHLRIIVGHWDIAYTDNENSDYNAVRIWGLSKDNLFWYIKSFVKQTKMNQAVRFMCSVQKSLPKTVIIHWQFEAQFWNDEVQRTIREVTKAEGVKLNISKVNTPRTKKYDRILSTYPIYQNNRTRYNAAMKSDADTNVGLNQLFGIEPGYTTKDDAPDADEQCISFLEKYVVIEYEDEDSDLQFKSGKMLPKNARI